MNNSLREQLEKLDLQLPPPDGPAGNYVSTVVSQNLLYVSGQIPMVDGQPAFIGRVGDTLSEEQGIAAAELAALGLLAQLDSVIGDDLSKLVQIVRLGVFVACPSDFTRQGAVGNGASNLLVSVLGKAGRHVRTSVGVSSLPVGVAVEVDAIFELKP
ncbi:RidA family protein [Pseudomonas quasicaspiana]|uniref:RidA family protein n=1 Tax=Pseudomonas quasicaspiana TaxID=2829821 RepID=UPI001E556B90|nr:RidA family protein [Pseudomonas quasicaspiana]MCD5973379.1 RidA family protein [Pseudomonas quasicaspiana]